MVFTKMKAMLKQRKVNKASIQTAVNQTMRGIKTEMNFEYDALQKYKRKQEYLKKLIGYTKQEGKLMKVLEKDLKVEQARMNMVAKNMGKITGGMGQPISNQMSAMANNQFDQIMKEQQLARLESTRILAILEKELDTISAMRNWIVEEVNDMRRQQGITQRAVKAHY